MREYIYELCPPVAISHTRIVYKGRIFIDISCNNEKKANRQRWEKYDIDIIISSEFNDAVDRPSPYIVRWIIASMP